jgi:acetyl-CoA synthetase
VDRITASPAVRAFTGMRGAEPTALSFGTYGEARDTFRLDMLWDLVDGDRHRLNIATECLDRHAGSGSAIGLRRADGQFEELSFADLAAWSSRFANFLAAEGISAGDRVAVMAEPSAGFYTALFGTLKRGSVAVPLFSLFGPDAVAARLDDCGARLLVLGTSEAGTREAYPGARTVVLDERMWRRLADQPDTYRPDTAPDDLAVLQYTSGTSRQLPQAVAHRHRAVVTVLHAALFGVGLRPGDRYFCPSSPAWGHGLWHGTIAPLALGIRAGAYAGRFDPGSLLQALRRFEVTNLAAASTVYRMLAHSGLTSGVPRLVKASYTGEALGTEAVVALTRELGTPVCGMYGTTETGVLIADFPGFPDYEVRPGALGKPLPGLEVAVLGEDGTVVPPEAVGEIAVARRGRWARTRDLGRADADGYFWYLGRADDVVISAGWTISPLEVEQAILAHTDIAEAAVIGVADPVRGQVLKAFVVSSRHDQELATEVQELVRSRLGPHEYPRQVEAVQRLPKTATGKIDRRRLRAREATRDPTAPPGAAGQPGRE